jgi:hypothetical protein
MLHRYDVAQIGGAQATAGPFLAILKTHCDCDLLVAVRVSQ